MDIKIQAMKEAIASAALGIRNGEGGPFGAAIVRGQEIIAVAHNTVIKSQDPTCHAEINAIRRAAAHLGNHILDQCELLTTAEPCPMCLSASYWARINRIHVGVGRSIAAVYGFDDVRVYDQVNCALEDRDIPIDFGIESASCEQLFIDWRKAGGILY